MDEELNHSEVAPEQNEQQNKVEVVVENPQGQNDTQEKVVEKKSVVFWKFTKKLCHRWFIDAFTGMAQGLFVTLIAGTIFKQIGQLIVNAGDTSGFGAVLVLMTGTEPACAIEGRHLV